MTTVIDWYCCIATSTASLHNSVVHGSTRAFGCGYEQGRHPVVLCGVHIDSGLQQAAHHIQVASDAWGDGTGAEEQEPKLERVTMMFVQHGFRVIESYKSYFKAQADACSLKNVHFAAYPIDPIAGTWS